MAIERSLPSKTLEEIMASLQLGPEGEESTSLDSPSLAEVGEVAILPESIGDATSL